MNHTPNPTTCNTNPETGRPALSRAETRTLLYVVAGLSTDQIAKRLDRSPETVKSHRESVMRKLGAANFVHATALAYERGILKPGTLAQIQERLALKA